MKRVDLNVDIGEGFPHDEALLEFATSANVCCGEHAGSFELTLATIELCRHKNVRIGMHPGFPDRESMGRAAMRGDQIGCYGASIHGQCQRFLQHCKPAYVKPHGAFYNMLADHRILLYSSCVGMLNAVAVPNHLPLMMLWGARVIKSERLLRLDVITEGFADRAYGVGGLLVPRSQPGAVLEDRELIRLQVLRLADVVDSVCIHGDTLGCVELAEFVVKSLRDGGHEVGG